MSNKQLIISANRYNLWIPRANRWTSEPLDPTGLPQDPNLPFQLTLEQAKEWMVMLTGFEEDPTGYFEIRPLDATTLPIISITDPMKIENDHVCPTCKNNRVSKLEKSCWLCGNKL